MRDTELNAIINRDLSKRIRSVNGITNHRQVARNDMKLCANIINNFDNRSGLWQSNNEQSSKENSYGVVSRNPVLQNITDFLIEEGSAEEEELLGEIATSEPEDNTEKDLQLFKVINYLRKFEYK